MPLPKPLFSVKVEYVKLLKFTVSCHDDDEGN